MGLSHAEFFRSLPPALAGAPHRVAGRRVSVDLGEGSLEIRLSEQGERRIASLALPVTHVEFRFRGLEADRIRAFMTRFERAFQRGGG